MIYDHNDYRNILRSQLSQKNSRGEELSLRAFAKKLGVSSSFLSEVVSGKKRLSVDVALKIAVRLKMNHKESQYFCLLAQLENEENPSFRNDILNRLKSLNPSRSKKDLSVDNFKLVSEWHHIAILELTELTGFFVKPETISVKISISRLQAELALDRLERLELIEPCSRNGFRKTNNSLKIESKKSNEAIKSFHSKLLEKAQKSVTEQTHTSRSSATDVIAIDSKKMQEIKKLSEDFSDALIKLSDESDIKDELFAVSTHIFSLLKTSNKNQKEN